MALATESLGFVVKSVPFDAGIQKVFIGYLPELHVRFGRSSSLFCHRYQYRSKSYKALQKKSSVLMRLK